MRQAESYREQVEARAGGACEYCRLLQAVAGTTYHIDHVVPQSRGGPTILSNLALSCPGCNLAKQERTHGRDHGGRIQPLFNPRDFNPWLLGWHLHFALEHETGIVLPRTPTGEATITTLRINLALRVHARKLQIFLGLTA